MHRRLRSCNGLFTSQPRLCTHFLAFTHTMMLSGACWMVPGHVLPRSLGELRDSSLHPTSFQQSSHLNYGKLSF